MIFISTKTYKHLGPVAYRQWRADSHCNKLHGYALSFHFEFEAETLDARNWVQDFGGLKPLKDKLEEWFDHTLLVAEDDPHKKDLLRLGELGLAKITLVEKTGCEGLAEFLYDYINDILLPDLYGKGEAERVWCSKVEVRETDSNMAMRVGHRPLPSLPRVVKATLDGKMVTKIDVTTSAPTVTSSVPTTSTSALGVEPTPPPEPPAKPQNLASLSWRKELGPNGEI